MTCRLGVLTVLTPDKAAEPLFAVLLRWTAQVLGFGRIQESDIDEPPFWINDLDDGLDEGMRRVVDVQVLEQGR